MLFAVYDETGRIIQANKVYDTPSPDYLAQMDSIGRPYVAVERETLVSPDQWFVLNGELTEMEAMSVAVSKTAIKAGGNDTVVLTGAPTGCEYLVECNVPGVGPVYPYSGTLDDGELEIGMDMPCLFTIRLSKWPMRKFAVQIEAVA